MIHLSISWGPYLPLWLRLVFFVLNLAITALVRFFWMFFFVHLVWKQHLQQSSCGGLELILLSTILNMSVSVTRRWNIYTWVSTSVLVGFTIPYYYLIIFVSFQPVFSYLYNKHPDFWCFNSLFFSHHFYSPLCLLYHLLRFNFTCYI